MKNRSIVKAIGLGIFALALVSLVFACSNAGNKVIEQYKSVGQQMLDAAKAADTAKVAELSTQLQEIGQQLAKLKLSAAQQKDLEDFTNKIMQDMLAPAADALDQVTE